MGNQYVMSQVEDFKLIYKESGCDLKEMVVNAVNKIGNVIEYQEKLMNGYVNEEKIVIYDFREGGIGTSGFCVSPYQNDDGTFDLVLESFSEYDGHTEYVGHFFVEDILNESFDEKQLHAVLYGNLIIDSREFNELDKSNEMKLSMDDFDSQFGYKTMLENSVYSSLEGYASLETAKFYHYSPRNSALIHGQFRGAKAVGSYKYWQEKGFQVQKGEKGIQVLVPNKTVSKFKNEHGKWKNIKYANGQQKKLIKKGELEKQNSKLYFNVGHVFDISQTNAKSEDIPEIFPNRWLEGSVEDYSVVMNALKQNGNDLGDYRKPV